jgi:RNA polymerase sporulation-specific sigma factor
VGAICRLRVFMQAVAIEDADRNTDDYAMIFAAQKGETEAIEYLLKKYKRIVLACVRYYFLPGAEKEDLIQEGMIALYYAIKGFNYQHPFPVFAKTCVARKMCTALRLHTSKKHKPLNDAFYLHKPVYEDEKKTFIDQVPVENKDPCDLVADMEERKWLFEQAQKNLTDLEKQVLTLYVDGLKYKDIADTLNLKPKTVDNALQRAKKKLREVFNDQRGD